MRALEKLPLPSRDLGMTARLITGSGTFMLTIVYLQPAIHVRSSGLDSLQMGCRQLQGLQTGSPPAQSSL